MHKYTILYFPYKCLYTRSKVALRGIKPLSTVPETAILFVELQGLFDRTTRHETKKSLNNLCYRDSHKVG